MSFQTKTLIKSFLKDSFLYTFFNLILRGIPFLLLPFIVRMIAIDEFGIYSIFISLESVFVPLIGLNLQSALNRHYFERESINFKIYVTGLLKSQVFSFLVIGMLILTLNLIPPINAFITKYYLFHCCISAFGLVIIGLTTTLLRVERKPILYGIFVISQAIMIFSVILIWINHIPKAQSLVNSRLTTFLTFALISIAFLLNKNLLGLKSSIALIKKAIFFAVPTIPHTIGAFLFVYSDRFIIQHYMGNEQVGYYSGIFQVSALISILASSFNAAWVPWLFQNLKKNDIQIDKLIIKVSYFAIITFVIGGIVFYLLFPLFSKMFLGFQFQKYNSLSIFFIIGFVAQSLYFIVVPYIFYIEKTKILSTLSIIAATINLGLNIILVPRIGLYGAAGSTSVSWLLLFILTFYYSNKKYKMPWI